MSISALAAAVLCNAAGLVPCCVDCDRALLNPAPWPANRVDDIRRPENGRIWWPRSPIGTRTPLREFNPGPAEYGAPPWADDEVIYALWCPTALPISPWCEHEIPVFREAKNQWLRDQGYVLKVRTHVNPRYFHGAAAPAPVGGMYGKALPTPRATIRINDELPRTPSRQRVDGSDVRIFRPEVMRGTGLIRVLPAEAPAVAQGTER